MQPFEIREDKMGITEIIIIALSLSLDAFAVSLCKGLALSKTKIKHSVVVGAWFGGFQALMPILGYFLAKLCASYITEFDHWIAFGLLALIGGNMIRSAIFDKEEETDASLGFSAMLILAIATSIDALAVGITFAFLGENIWVLATSIGVTTFALSGIGVKLGSLIGAKLGKKAELVGGLVLVIIGTKILFDHVLV